jgi:hypothetical protein
MRMQVDPDLAPLDGTVRTQPLSGCGLGQPLPVRTRPEELQKLAFGRGVWRQFVLDHGSPPLVHLAPARGGAAISVGAERLAVAAVAQ